ncbi:MAG: hypothetical protein K2X47_11910 [Bdellovibrionales bacterium]|nr:hypothetical protein [Bdellovibrionales bacterium]
MNRQYGTLSGLFGIALIVLTFQNCGEATKLNMATATRSASSSSPQGTNPNSAPPHPIGRSKLLGCSKPQVISVPGASAESSINVYILARGVVGNENCPDPYGPYVEPYRVVPGTSGAPAGPVQPLGGQVYTDPVGVFDVAGSTIYFFGLSTANVLSVRTLMANWAPIGNLAVAVLPNTLCNPKVQPCFEPGFSVVNSFLDRNEFHIATTGPNGQVFIRALNQPWINLAGGAYSMPVFKRSTRLGTDVLQVRGGGDLCYQQVMAVDLAANLVPNGTWAAGCD